MRTHALLALVVALTVHSFTSVAEGVLYSERPKITDVEAHSGDKYTKVLQGYLDFLIELHAFYPSSRRIFLARDSETLFDLDALITSQFGQGEAQPEILNISTASRDSESVENYLTARRLDAGSIQVENPPVLVDTGFEGSIVERINGILRPQRREVRAHLISSANPKIPSSRIATRVFFKGRLTASNKEKYLDAIDQVVERIEGLPHYTATAEDYVRTATGWEAMTASRVDRDEQRQAIELMQAVRHFATQPEVLARIKAVHEPLSQLMTLLRSDRRLDQPAVEKLKVTLESLNFHLLWPDLREAAAKGTLHVRGDRLVELWAILGLPELPDLEEEELQALEELESGRSQRVEVRPEVLAKRRAGRLLIEEIMSFHRRAQLPNQQAKYTERHQSLIHQVQSGKIAIPGMGRQSIGPVLGEGYRGTVYALGENYALKISTLAEDMRYIEVELKVAQYLRDNFHRYGITTLKTITHGAGGRYIVRPRFDQATVAHSILKRGLTPEQLEHLQRLFERARQFAWDTGVGLDLRSQNLAWIDNEWVLFDVGPRTSYGPYGFTLAVSSFEEFLKLFDQEDPEGEELSLEAVIRQIKSGRCADALR